LAKNSSGINPRAFPLSIVFPSAIAPAASVTPSMPSVPIDAITVPFNPCIFNAAPRTNS
jgi:hypothetical protein